MSQGAATVPSGQQERIARARVGAACKMAAGMFRPYLEGGLSEGESALLEEHLDACPRCARAFDDHQNLHSLMDETLGAREIRPGFNERADRRLFERNKVAKDGTPPKAITAEHLGIGEEEEEPLPPESESLTDSLVRNFGAAPWWIISGAFHALVLLLVTLIGLAILRAQDKDVVIVTDLEQRKEPEKLEEPVKRDIIPKPETVLDEEIETEQTPIVTHEEVEISDHVETADDSDAAETRGEDGISDVWLGGSGTVAALGLGGGGGGAFGRPGGKGGRLRRAIRGGGGRATESAVDAALAWLARNQEADGHWDVKKHEGSHATDPGVTALAVLAFLGAGHTEKIGKYKENVRRGVAWIISKQDKDGAIGRGYTEVWHKNNDQYAYHHSMCGLALAEAAGMARVPATVQAAQRAVNYTTEVHQVGKGSEKGAWRYNPGKDSDASVSGWFVMQLKSAKIAGLQVNPASYEGALRFYDSIEVKKGKGNEPYGGGRFPYKDGFKVSLNPTAIGILCNLFLGRKPANLAGGAHFLAQNLPTWSAKCGASQLNKVRYFPMYYTYYGTLTMFQMGGDYWKVWNAAMKNMLLPTQCRGGDKDGSWDPVGGSDDEIGGRVYMTATGALCLEVYYRYLRSQDRPSPSRHRKTFVLSMP